MNNDTSWIRKTLRRTSMKKLKTMKAQSKTLTRQGGLDRARKASKLADKKELIERKRKESKRRLESMKMTDIEVPEVEVEPKEDAGKDSNGDVKAEEVSSEYDSEYESEYDSEYDSEQEEGEGSDEEMNELNFDKLLELRIQDTDFQLDSFCTKYIFVLEETGVKIVHNLADEFEELCRAIYLPMLKPTQRRRKTTLRKVTLTDVREMAATSIADEKIPKELPTEHEDVVAFFEDNDIKFLSDEDKEKTFKGMHVGENCCFLQFLLLRFREMVIDQHLERWGKQREEIASKNIGALVLEEFFMPPLKVEPKLDEELVKFSNLMANRQFEISQFQKKMAKKDENSVAYNILKKELHKYVKELEEKINKSEIYFAAAIMRVRQKQEKELQRIYEVIEAEDGVKE